MDGATDEIVRAIGTLQLSVAFVGRVPDETGGGLRCRYRYTVESTDPETPGSCTDDDLFSGTGAPVDAWAAMQALGSYLSAAGEAYGYRMAFPERELENADLFPAWVAEAAYLNSDELATLALEGDLLATDTAAEPAASARYVSVVFQEGDDAEETLRILDEQGPQAALEHLAQWDFGAETDDAAEVFDGFYAEAPLGETDRVFADGEYVMTYSLAHRHVGLVRRTDPVPPQEPHPDTPAGRRHRLADLSPETPGASASDLPSRSNTRGRRPSLDL